MHLVSHLLMQLLLCPCRAWQVLCSINNAKDTLGKGARKEQ
jgi:hypothetical protein